MTDRQRRYETLGILMTFHAFPDEVMDKYCLVEAIVPPGCWAPPNHHRGETESFLVIEGTLDFTLGGTPRQVGPGESINVPDGAVHAFQATGTTPARVMILNAPGRMHAEFFTRLGKAVADGRALPAPMDGPPDLARVMEEAGRVGMTILAPAEAR
jgi:mannose-6-phosphate isomerase-like protein (cupin superfamily)